MMTNEAREARGTFWLQHWRECEALAGGAVGRVGRIGGGGARVRGALCARSDCRAEG